MSRKNFYCGMLLLAAIFMLSPSARAEEKKLLWGDTHLHTANSFDAYLNRNNTADPETAYNFAKGLPVIHPYHRARVQIQTPLDFLVIADHAELLGVIRTIVEKGTPTEGLGVVDKITAYIGEWWIRGVIEDDTGMETFASFLPDTQNVEEAAKEQQIPPVPNGALIVRNTWLDAIATADRHNDPGTFTTLIGWEWSSIPAGANLHRVVFTDVDASVAAKFLPFSSGQSMYAEDLWTFLDETNAATGAEFVAIPHNSNISKGYMFGDTMLKSGAYTRELAEKRLRHEPVVEITQIKGDSETHSNLSPEDPFADFETYPHYIQQNPPPYKAHKGDYIRSALKRGLMIEEKIGFNPYQFGVIGSTDSHSGVSSAEEPNFWGKMARDSTPETKDSGWSTRGGPDGTPGPNGWVMSAAGLAAVWAEDNSRTAILEAFRRREVYATTGPRMVVRLQADWSTTAGAVNENAEVHAEAIPDSLSVPMGGELHDAPTGAQPRFAVHVLKDPKSANLDRVQIIKGWTAGGEAHERIYDIAWSGDRELDAAGELPPVGNTVDPKRGTYSNEIGAPELEATWTDPDFDPTQKAFYYVRVLEIPTPRHSMFDFIALGVDAPEQRYPWWLQERAYTSPVWYKPTSNS
ncbi:MAG: DUF3604 domain-containing protein [Candidatus Binatia bacterium]|nr:DUF3604 domain-containing protein [Candidatus Binatia bacterium]MDG2008438.1 DUF3604 domain-containing protein [Candidatus Binatia bacterium]